MCSWWLSEDGWARVQAEQVRMRQATLPSVASYFYISEEREARNVLSGWWAGARCDQWICGASLFLLRCPPTETAHLWD